MRINTFDIDGVINMGEYDGVYPGPSDVIITGRSYEEVPETLKLMDIKGIKNNIHFNRLPFKEKTRESSGEHKVKTIKELIDQGFTVGIHFEDDPIQAKIIEKALPGVKIVLLVHNLVEKENVRHIL